MAFLNTMNTSVTPNGAMLQQSSSSSWVIDSGTTAHFCRDRSLLVDFIATTPATVRMGSATTTSTAKGTAVLWVSTDGVNYDRRVTLKNVLYVPDFTVNLVSVRKLARAGYGLHVMGNTGNAHLTMADNTPFAVVHGNDRDDLYVLEARTSKSCPANAGSYRTAQSSAGGEQNEAVPVCAVSLNVHSAQILAAPRDVSPLRLMHERLNHLNVRQMVQMRASDMVDGAHSLPSSIPPSGSRLSCESCIIGKSHRATMPRKATAQRVTRCLQLVHSDVCGPVRCPAFNDEARYLVTFVDDFSRYVVVYAMKTRDEVLGHFKVYRAWAEKATGHKIATLRTDGGGEYTSGAFTAHLRQEGIQRQLTPPHTPEHNGVAERLNLIIFGAVRCMLNRARLPASFWAEAAFNAVYVRNRCPTRAVKDRTPYEVWTGHKPSIDHLRVFGCLAYVHVDDAARRTGKLEGRGFPCVFLGYSSESKAWRLYNPASKTTQKRLFVSRDVTFLEDQLVDIDGVLTSSRVGEGQSAADLFPDAGVDASMSGHEDSDSLPALIPPPADLGMSALLPPPADLDIFNLDVGDEAANDDYDEDEDGYSFLDTLPLRQLFPAELEAAGRAQQALYAIQRIQHRQAEEQMRALSTTVLDADEPTSHADAMASPDAHLWLAAIQAEYESQQSAGTYELTELPSGRQAIGCKWVFKVKRHADGSIDRYKARLVARGYSQKEGLDYKETFAPVAKFASIRTLLALAAHQDYEVHQMDVKTAFLNGDLDVDLYMQQPEGFLVAGQEELVCKLRKSIYGLKQAGRAWFEKQQGAYSPAYRSSPVEEQLPSCPTCGAAAGGGKHTYASVVGAIMYAMLGTRPDLAFAIGLLTRFNSNPGKSHVGALKRVLRYLKGSIDFQLTYGAESSGSSGSMLAVLGHCDSDWGGSIDDRRSVSGTVFTIAGGAVTWQAQRQESVALSAVEAEYMAACQTAKNAVWLRAFLVGLGLNASAPTSIHCDSQGAIALAKNPEHHQRSRHIDKRYCYAHGLSLLLSFQFCFDCVGLLWSVRRIGRCGACCALYTSLSRHWTLRVDHSSSHLATSHSPLYRLLPSFVYGNRVIYEIYVGHYTWFRLPTSRRS